MSHRQLSYLTRRAMLGATLFAGASLALKGCANNGSTTANTPDSTPAAATATNEPATNSQAGKTLVSTTLPGSWEQFNRNTLVPQFASATGAQASLVTAVSADQIAKLQSSPNNPPFDVLSLDSGVFAGAPKEELFQKLPVNLLKNYQQLAEQFQSPDPWGALIGVQAVGIAYNPKIITTPPQSWTELWNEKYKGRVALMAMRNNHTIGFMQQVAKIRGGSKDNLDPAFTALEELAPNLAGVVANSGALITLFEQGEVVIAPHDLNSVRLLQNKGVDIDWVLPQEGGFALTPLMSVVKNPTADLELAAAYIDAALSQDVQTKMVETNAVLPTNKDVTIPTEIAEKLGKNLDEILAKLELMDWTTINQNRTKWVEKFDKIVQS